MRIITALFVCFILSLTNTNARSFSGGLRTGTAFWRGGDYQQPHKVVTTMVWESELFARYESKKHFAIELGFSTYKLPYTIPLMDDYNPPDGDVHEVGAHLEGRFYAAMLHVQYGFSCGHIKGLMNYPGIMVAPMQEIIEEHSDYLNTVTGERSSSVYSGEAPDYHIQAGIEDEVRYTLTPHIQVHTLVSYKWSTEQWLLRRAFTAQVGAAWKF